jgi:hypothetical protein
LLEVLRLAPRRVVRQAHYGTRYCAQEPTGKMLLEGSKFTSDKLPVKLVYYEEFERVEDTFNREHQVKKWSRKKKEALIIGDIDALKEAAKSSQHKKNRDG